MTVYSQSLCNYDDKNQNKNEVFNIVKWLGDGRKKILVRFKYFFYKRREDCGYHYVSLAPYFKIFFYAITDFAQKNIIIYFSKRSYFDRIECCMLMVLGKLIFLEAHNYNTYTFNIQCLFVISVWIPQYIDNLLLFWGGWDGLRFDILRMPDVALDSGGKRTHIIIVFKGYNKQTHYMKEICSI